MPLVLDDAVHNELKLFAPTLYVLHETIGSVVEVACHSVKCVHLGGRDDRPKRSSSLKSTRDLLQ